MLHVPSPISPLISYSRRRVPIGSVCPGSGGAAALTASSSESGVIVVSQLPVARRSGGRSRDDRLRGARAVQVRLVDGGLVIVTPPRGRGGLRDAARGATKSRHRAARRPGRREVGATALKARPALRRLNMP